MSTYRGWHFTARKTLDRNGGRLVRHERLPEGTQPVLCQVGLHASARALDAVAYAPGMWIRQVELRGLIVADGDKACATERLTLAGPVNASRVLREFACDCAEQTLVQERAAGREPAPRSWAVVEVARRYARGDATAAELRAARNAATAALATSSAAAAAWNARAAAAIAHASAADAARDWQRAELERRLRRLLGLEEET